MERDRTVGALAAAMCAVTLSACTNPQTVLTQLLEARRLAAEQHVQFTRAAEAANRAVMADTDEASAAAADEARRARQVVERDTEALRAILESLGYRDDVRHLEAFGARFEEYRRLDDEILPLAVENTNVKAQRLSFGPAREAAATAAAALDRFTAVHAEIIALSRQNTGVRSLALSLGRKHLVTAECEAHLQALEDALAKHGFTATR